MMDFCKTVLLYVTAPIWFPVVWFLFGLTDAISEAPDGSDLVEENSNE